MLLATSRLPGSRPTLGGSRLLQRVLELAVAVSGAALAVVAAQLLPVVSLAIAVLVELGRVLDLLLAAVDEDRLRVQVDIAYPRPEARPLTENPWAGVND